MTAFLVDTMMLAWIIDSRSVDTPPPFAQRNQVDAVTLDWDHRDPFDRIVVATARRLDARIVTTDRVILHFAGDDA